jgi:hypothetical protein
MRAWWEGGYALGSRRAWYLHMGLRDGSGVCADGWRGGGGSGKMHRGGLWCGGGAGATRGLPACDGASCGRGGWMGGWRARVAVEIGLMQGLDSRLQVVADAQLMNHPPVLCLCRQGSDEAGGRGYDRTPLGLWQTYCPGVPIPGQGQWREGGARAREHRQHGQGWSPRLGLGARHDSPTRCTHKPSASSTTFRSSVSPGGGLVTSSDPRRMRWVAPW